MKPLVSVIIPVYNAELTIINTLDSVLNQTWENIEIICVNDGSTDKSLDILDAFQKKHQEKIFIFDVKNSGACKARNLGISKAKGDYIQFLDADDLISSNKIEAQVEKLLETNRNCLASCQWMLFENQPPEKIASRKLSVYKDYESGWKFLLDLWNNQEMMIVNAWLIPKKIIEEVGGWDESLSKNQDGEYITRILLKSSGVKFVPDITAYYRSQADKNISQQKTFNSIESVLQSYKTIEHEVRKSIESKEIILGLKKLYLKFIYDTFPKYPSLIKEAESKINNLPFKDPVFIGGPKFIFLTKVVGFKNALRLKRVIQ